MIKEAFKYSKEHAGALSVIPIVLAGMFYFLGWLDTNYARADAVTNNRTQLVSLEKKLDSYNQKQERRDLEQNIEETGDKIYDLNRTIRNDGAAAREEDRQQLDKLERRLERDKRDLRRLDST